MNAIHYAPVHDSDRGAANMADEKRDWITIAEAASIMGLEHVESVRRLCRKGKIKCRQFIEGVSAWEVWREDAENYTRDWGGRPHKD